MAAIAVLVFIALLAGCGYGFWMSCKLMFRGFRGIFAQTTQDSPTVPLAAVSPSTRPGVPPWVLAIVRHHLGHCRICAEAVREYTGPGETLEQMLNRMEPVTVERMVRVVEREDA